MTELNFNKYIGLWGLVNDSLPLIENHNEGDWFLFGDKSVVKVAGLWLMVPMVGVNQIVASIQETQKEQITTDIKLSEEQMTMF